MLTTCLRPNHGRRKITGLSLPEQRVLQHLAHGHGYQEIANTIHRSIDTIKDHARNAISKLGAKNRAHAVHIATKRGLVE